MGKTFRLTVNDKTYDIEVGDLGRAEVEVLVDGERFNVRMEDTPAVDRGPDPVMSIAVSPFIPPPSPPPAPKAARPAGPAAAGDAKTLCAPMPGVVLAVRVKVGDRVKRGQEVCLLESMKMELNILANADGVVKKVSVSQGQSVGHGAILVEFD